MQDTLDDRGRMSRSQKLVLALELGLKLRGMVQKTLNLVIFIIIILSPLTTFAADPLSSAHAKLDNSDQCDACHGDDIQVAEPQKCRACHQEIDTRIKRAKGYHGRIRGNVNCNLCHREHLGRRYSIIQMNIRTFNHNETGWPLSGKHAKTECRQCHTEKRESGRDSYLNTSPECNSCHGDFHGQGIRADLSDCGRCHNAFNWSQINAKVKFDHQKETRYPLVGLHREVDCLECHTQRDDQGKVKAFAPIQVQGCDSCHKDPHPRGIFNGITCEECHNTKGFRNTKGFNHKSTGWPLKGAHRKAECLECHKWEQWEPESQECRSCHEDIHRGQFGLSPCSDCHQESSFKKLVFNHDTQSRFPLRGKHRRARCDSCHKKGHYRPMEMECESCHIEDNPHGDTFKDSSCSQCHTPSSWKKIDFDHSVTGFPLEARHVEQPCYRCHPNGTEVEDDTQSECTFCHTKTIHGQQFMEYDCNRCHRGAESWAINFFDHNNSRFKLMGKHETVPCDGCHKNGHFKPIDTACANCHQNFHEGQFEQRCETCHNPKSWSEAVFDHQKQSQYPLEGLHQLVDCKKCHLQNQYKPQDQECQSCHLDIHLGEKGPECKSCHTLTGWETNQAINHDFGPFKLGGVHDQLPCERCHGADRQKMLSGTGPECSTCHRDPHFSSFGPLCQDCHTQESFLPSTFLHNTTGFRLSGAHRFVACRECHPGRVFGGLPKDCSFCHTDTFQSTVGSDCDHPANCSAALSSCQECHTTSQFERARPGAQCGTCEAGGIR